MKINWGNGPWGWGHIVYCNNGCLVCALPIAVKDRGYIPRSVNKRDRSIATENVRKHICEREERRGGEVMKEDEIGIDLVA